MKYLFLIFSLLFLTFSLLFLSCNKQENKIQTLLQEPGNNIKIPLIDMTAGETYYGFTGGLYSNGSNTMPLVLKQRYEAVKNILGKNIFISIGMSNTNYKFGKFIELYQSQSKAIMINCAIPGKAAESWSNSNNVVWTKTVSRVQKRGTIDDVQTAWIELADRVFEPYPVDPIPYITTLKNRIKSTITILKQKFPKIKIVYLSSRTYGGYAVGGSTNPEPFAYASGLACQQAILELINDTNLPVVVWGVYFWADGLNPRSDGLIWNREDFGDDGMHPSGSPPFPTGFGTTKCAGLMYDFFKLEPWFSKWM